MSPSTAQGSSSASNPRKSPGAESAVTPRSRKRSSLPLSGRSFKMFPPAEGRTTLPAPSADCVQSLGASGAE